MSKRIRLSSGAYRVANLDNSEWSLSVPQDAFLGTVEQVSRSYSRDETRPTLTGILTSVERGRMRMVTTDSYRLSIKEMDIASAGLTVPEVIIPGRAAREVCRLFSDSGANRVEIAFSDTEVLFQSGDEVLGARLLKSRFPEYRKVIPRSFEREITVDRRNLTSILRRANRTVARTRSKVLVSLLVSKGTVTVVQEVEEADEVLGILWVKENYSSEDDFVVSFDPGYLLDGAEVVDTDDLVLHLNKPLRPVLMTSATRDDVESHLRYLIMPMRVPSRVYSDCK